MSLNAQKTKCMSITTRQKRQRMSTNSLSVSISGVQIEEVKSHRVLGIVVDNNLSWSDHVAHLCKRLSQKVFQLSRVKHFLNIHARKQFFHAHIQTIIDYASTLWDCASANVLKPLYRLHKRALKLVLLKSSTLTSNDYKSLDILPLKQKLEYNKAVLMHKVAKGDAPPSIMKNFPINQSRHVHKITVPLPRIDLFKSSFIYSGGTYWNNLPLHLKEMKNQNSFKYHLKKSIYFIK